MKRSTFGLGLKIATLTGYRVIKFTWSYPPQLIKINSYHIFPKASCDKSQDMWRSIKKKAINNNLRYYSFNMFPRFWLVKSTRTIHHNQLLMTKFGRILCLTRKWRQKCSPLQVNAPLPEKTWGRGWIDSVVKTKMENTSLVSRVRTTAGTRRNNR